MTGEIGRDYVLERSAIPTQACPRVIGGQVMVVTAGRGFVETGGERVEVAVGDVIICPPGELHTHGALDDQSFAHLTVTTGGYTFPPR